MNSNKQHVLCHSNFPQFLTQIFFWTFWIWFRHKCIDFFDLSQHLELKWIQHFLSYIYSKGIHMSLYVSLYCVLYYVLISWIPCVTLGSIQLGFLHCENTQRGTQSHTGAPSVLCFLPATSITATVWRFWRTKLNSHILHIWYLHVT